MSLGHQTSPMLGIEHALHHTIAEITKKVNPMFRVGLQITPGF
jgi:hypothetical protein